MYFRKIALMACCGALALTGLFAEAAPVSPLEVKIELRVLDFIAEPAGRSVVAVLYDRDRSGSAEEAAELLSEARLRAMDSTAVLKARSVLSHSSVRKLV